MHISLAAERIFTIFGMPITNTLLMSWIAMAVLMFGLWAVSLGAGLGIGNTAHLGGLIIGLGYGFYLKKKYPHKTKMISRYFTK